MRRACAFCAAVATGDLSVAAAISALGPGNNRDRRRAAHGTAPCHLWRIRKALFDASVGQSTVEHGARSRPGKPGNFPRTSWPWRVAGQDHGSLIGQNLRMLAR